MNTFSRYLISLLLTFGLTVTQYPIYSQANATSDTPLSTVIARRVFSHTGSKLYVYAQRIPVKKIRSLFLDAYRHLLSICGIQSQVILKLQTRLFQTIHSSKTQQDFLSITFTSGNSYSSLYIA